MVYNTSENYNLGQLRAKLLTRQENRANHVNYGYSKLKSQSRKGEDDIIFIDKVSAIGRIQLQDC